MHTGHASLERFAGQTVKIGISGIWGSVKGMVKSIQDGWICIQSGKKEQWINADQVVSIQVLD